MRKGWARCIAALGVSAMIGTGTMAVGLIATAAPAQAQFIKPVPAPAGLSAVEVQWRGHGPRPGRHVGPRPGPRYGGYAGRGYRGPPRGAGRYYGGRGYYGPARGYYGRPGYYSGSGYNAGAAAAAGIAGLAAGAIVGGAIASQQGAPVAQSNGDWIAYCSSKYRSFDPSSGTYLGYDGNRYTCQ